MDFFLGGLDAFIASDFQLNNINQRLKCKPSQFNDRCFSGFCFP
jgi:hypothetical protein